MYISLNPVFLSGPVIMIIDRSYCLAFLNDKKDRPCVTEDHWLDIDEYKKPVRPFFSWILILFGIYKDELVCTTKIRLRLDFLH